MLSLTAARWLLVLHAVLGAAAVAAATHWVVWLWPLWRGRAPRAAAMRRFATIALALYGAAMAVGLLLYPTYKARVKLEYLTRPTSVIDDHAVRRVAADELADRAAGRVPGPVDEDRARRLAGDAPTRAAKIARWFDAKEHWAAVGLVLGLGVLAVVRAWRPGEHEPVRDGPVALVVLGALAVAAVAWFAAIVGLLTTATRSF
ncbi:MAG: hypothetical protein IPL61_26315 [Myxococcales bacterium]|nr:hypothetical protein [Myxococcales bacterium]